METQHIYLHWFVQQRFSHVSCFSFATVFSLVFVVVLFFFMLLWILKFYYQLLVKSFQIFLKKSDKTFLVMISSVQSLSRVRLFATPLTAACQASPSITNSRSLPRLMSIESVMPSSHLILSSTSPPAPNPSQHQSLFQWVNSSHEVAKVLEFQL